MSKEKETQEKDPIVGIPPDTIVHDMHIAASPVLWHYPKDVWDKIHERATGKGTRISINDTGVRKHNDLPASVERKSFIPGQSTDDPLSGHGTHCAGTALGRNGIGAAPEADLMVGKCLSNQGSGASSGIAASIDWAVENGADVVSLSLGGPNQYQPTRQAIINAWEKGVIVVAAAGNAGFAGGRNTIGYPGKFKESICVGATRSDGSIANFSSGGREVDIACPGQAIISCSNRGGYVAMSGTSMATPMMAGVLALIVELMRKAGKPNWTAKESFTEFITNFVEDRGAPGKDPRFGHGVPLYTRLVHALSHDDLDL